MNVIIVTETSVEQEITQKLKLKSDYLVCVSYICKYILIVNWRAAGKCQETSCNQVMQETELSDKYMSWASPYSKEESDQENCSDN